MNPEAFVFVPDDKKNEIVNNNNESPKLTIDTSQDKAYDHESVIQDAVKFQIEYHFSDTNLSMDNYLLSRMHEDPQYWVAVKTVANLTKIRSLTESEETVLQAIKDSDMLVLNSDETKVKRPSFVPPKPKQHKDLRRTVFLYGLSKDMATEESVIKLCHEFGKVKCVYFDIVNIDNGSKDFDFEKGKTSDNGDKVDGATRGTEGSIDGPDRDVALVLMTKRFGGRLIRQSSLTHGGSISTTNGNAMQVSNDMLNGIVPPSPSPLYSHPISNPNGNPLDFSHLRSCFVVFESQSQANKLVKVRSRAQDGVRAMHQYDFNKARKKVAAAKAKGISPVFSPAHIALALSPNQDTSKILANTVAITPKERRSGNNLLSPHSVHGHSQSGRMSDITTAMSKMSMSSMSGLSGLSGLSGGSRRSHLDSNDSFVSQGSQMGSTNVALSGRASDTEWQLKQENFELQKQNLTLQHALQQNMEAMKQMQLLYSQQRQFHSNHPMSVRNGRNDRHFESHNHHGRSTRRHTVDNRPHTTKHGAKHGTKHDHKQEKEINAHFGDWRQPRRFTMPQSGTMKSAAAQGVGGRAVGGRPVGGRPVAATSGRSRQNNIKPDIQIGLAAVSKKYRANKNNPQSMTHLSMKHESKKGKKVNGSGTTVGKLFFELDKHIEPIAPSNTPQSQSIQGVSKEAGNENGSRFVPVASINDASLKHLEHRAPQQPTATTTTTTGEQQKAQQ